jgi:hypothetical protein
MAVLLALMFETSTAGQTPSAATDIVPLGAVFPAEVLRDLPLGDNIYSLLETTQSEVISDRFNSGGLNVGDDARVGGFLGSWSQTLFRIGDIDVSDPVGSGSSLIFPDASLWQRVDIATGLMPADINTPGLAVTLSPLRGASDWKASLAGSGAGGSLVAGAPSDQPMPIARLKDFAHGAATVSGPLAERFSLAAAGTYGRGSSYRRELLANTNATSASAFAHVTFASSQDREWRVLGIVQRDDSPFENWQPFLDSGSMTRDTAVHVQTSLEQHPPDGALWRVFAGFTQRDRENSVAGSPIRISRIVEGPVEPIVASAADVTARRVAVGARLTPARPSASSHRLDFGIDLDNASTSISGNYAGAVREFVDTLPARIWFYEPGGTSDRNVLSVAGFARDRIALGTASTLDAGVRAEVVHGAADGAAMSITWLSLLPHAYLRWPLSEKRSFVVGYGRSANALTQNWLAFGDPAAPTATVVSAAAPTVTVSNVGPGTGGNSAFSGIDDGLKRPYTDEFVIGYEKRRSPSTRYTLTGIARREANLLGVLNTGVPASSYSTIALPDAGKDLTDPSDDRLLYVYNRLPASFGKDAYLLTNPGQDAATVYALRMSFEHSSDRLFLLFGATASVAEGSGGNRGYGALENDQDVPGELFTNPNGASYARGRLFSDRAFTIKWTTLYRFPADFTVAGIARYQDGQPFSRIVIAPQLNQGAEGVQTYPNGGSRYTFTGTFDLRVQKGFRFGRSRVDVFLDAYNLFTRNNEVEEYVVSGPEFRTPTAIQPPQSAHLGLRLSF